MAFDWFLVTLMMSFSTLPQTFIENTIFIPNTYHGPQWYTGYRNYWSFFSPFHTEQNYTSSSFILFFFFMYIVNVDVCCAQHRSFYAYTHTYATHSHPLGNLKCDKNPNQCSDIVCVEMSWTNVDWYRRNNVCIAIGIGNTPAANFSSIGAAKVPYWQNDMKYFTRISWTKFKGTRCNAILLQFFRSFGINYVYNFFEMNS